MSDVKLPIETYRKGNKITKICVEDVHKVVERVCETIAKSVDNTMDIFDSVRKKHKDHYGSYVIGIGRSQPCLNDAFDEEIGNNISFMKAKLSTNIKKHNMLVKAYNEMVKVLDSIDDELVKVDDYIIKDLNGIRMYNSSYLDGIENKLGIYEVQA